MPLRLKSLELYGYKTFAARTVFEFAEGITAIVGPNGSGKSNIADAMRWVLGEQSFSLLRAKKTEDMIFSGSEQRTRAGMASATVLFENSDGWLPVDYSEVGLARRAYRDGRNEYMLNGQHVRLREINELLAQSGLGERTYTILGQGLVDASLALRADERRRLFEEAAGVGLYRARREESLRRLENTQRNLERVQDIMAELEPRLRSLERQARRAREYAQAQADLRVLLREWYGYQWHQAQKELTASRERVRQHEAKVREAREVYQKYQYEFNTYRERLQELRSRLNVWHHQSAELHSQREAISRDLAVLDERRRSLLAVRQSYLVEQDHNGDELQIARERLAEAEQESTRLRSEHIEAKSQFMAAQQALQTCQGERAGIEEKLQAARQQVNEINAQRAELQARVDELMSRIEGQQRKLEVAEQAIISAEGGVTQAEENHRTAVSECERAEKFCNEAESNLNAQQEKIDSLEGVRRQRIEEHIAAEAEQTRLKAQLEVLEQAEQSLAGYAEGARFLLNAARQARLKGARGALSVALDVSPDLETAIAAALGDHLDAILLESGRQVEQALRLLESDQAGRAALLPLDWLAHAPTLEVPTEPDCLGVAAELVHVPAEFRRAVDLLLGSTLIVKNRAVARQLIKGQPLHVKVVTLRGEVFRADGAILAGKQVRSATLGRPRQRRELQETLADLSKQVAKLDENLQRLSDDLAEARLEQSGREKKLKTERARLDAAQATGQQAALNLESARRQYEWQRSQREQLHADSIQAEAEHQQAVASQAKVEAEITQFHEQVRTLNTQLVALVLDEVQEQVTYWITRSAVAERGLSDAHIRQNERQEALAQLEVQKQDIVRRMEETDQTLMQLQADKESLRQQESNLNMQLEELRLQIEPSEKELETAEQGAAQYQEKESAAQRVTTTAERIHGQVQLDLTRRQEALDSLRQRIQDDFGLVMFAYDADVAGPLPLPFDGMVEQLPVVTELSPDLEEQLIQQRALLRRIGPINPEAQKEYDSERERLDFLAAQVADLNKAEADLRQVITELDDMTKREFDKTFEAVAKEFRDIFVRLFGGGSADLILTNPENLVETGIDIEARLPGRREQGLALLSGGERSLTAIALVFALLRVSPTPVCVLDEVDAMLDEVNVVRFRELLAELSKDTQFIIITHNRSTVQVADVIYGVTMGRDSTSQVISLRLDEVSEELFR
jgi:chromosome segregation protein